MQLVIKTNMFSTQQSVYAIENENVKEIFSTTTNTLAHDIVEYTAHHSDITEIIFYGNTAFNFKFKQDLMNLNITQYCTKNLQIYLKEH